MKNNTDLPGCTSRGHISPLLSEQQMPQNKRLKGMSHRAKAGQEKQ